MSMEEDVSLELSGRSVLDKIDQQDPIVRRCTYALINSSENYESSTIGQLSAKQYQDFD